MPFAVRTAGIDLPGLVPDVPYLLRTLATSNFGSIAFANTVMAQFILLTDFGFASSATRLFAIQARDGKQFGNLFSAVMTVKCLLLVLSALIVASLALWCRAFMATAPCWLSRFFRSWAVCCFRVGSFRGLSGCG